MFFLYCYLHVWKYFILVNFRLVQNHKIIKSTKKLKLNTTNLLLKAKKKVNQIKKNNN